MRWTPYLAEAYMRGRALMARRAPVTHIDPIEVQLDIMVHATQITERYPFTKVGSTT